MSAYVSICQPETAYASGKGDGKEDLFSAVFEAELRHIVASAYVSIRQHTSAYVSIR